MNQFQTAGRYSIRQSTDEDIRTIHAWLLDHRSRGVEDTFLCNWNVIERSHHRGEVIVCAERENDLAVAYEFGGLLVNGILEVRSDLRGKGIGKRMVEHRIKDAYEKGESILHIECAPHTSIPFWKRMGFTTYETAYATYAYRVLEKRNVLPDGESLDDVTIRFYPEAALYKPGTPPLVEKNPKAVVGIDGVIYLAERVSCFDQPEAENRDIAIEICIGGEKKYFEKAKRDAAQDIGVRTCINGFSVDSIRLSSIEDDADE